MPRKIRNAAHRIQLNGGSIYKYPYRPAWILDVTVNGERRRITLSRDQREAIGQA
jgi:hypothetical protein